MGVEIIPILLRSQQSFGSTLPAFHGFGKSWFPNRNALGTLEVL